MNEQKKNEEKERQEYSNRAKEIWLAGLGALSAVEEEGSKFFRSLIDRGAEFEKRRKDQVNDIMNDVSDRVGETYFKAEETVEKNIRSIVSGMGIPTRKEVKELSEKVDRLSAKVEELKMQKPTGPELKKTDYTSASKKNKM